MALEARLQEVEKPYLQLTFEGSVSEALGEARLEGIADCGDGGALEDAEEGAGYCGEEMRVFVGVHVGDGDAGLLEFADLGEGFALNVVFADAAAEESVEEVDERGTEVFAVRAEEGRDGFWWRGGSAVGDDDVATDA